MVEKTINPESKGYGNLGRENSKDLVKAHENEELEWAKNVQKNEMGQESPEAMKWAKEAQNSMSTSPMIMLGY